MTSAPTHTPTESTPLLVPALLEEDAVVQDSSNDLVSNASSYDRFPTHTKQFIVFLISLIGLMPLLVSGTLVPSIPHIARDLHSTGDVISLAVSISILITALGASFWASNSTFYGRRPVYLIGLPFLMIGSAGVGHSRNVSELMLWRVVQAFGASGGVSVGGGVVGDLFKLEERGTIMGIFFSVLLLGRAISPSLGGLGAYYASWRAMQYALGIAAAALFVVMFMFFPETMDKNDQGLEKLNATLKRPKRFVFVNPFRSLSTLRAPTLSILVISSLSLLVTENVLLIPSAYTIGERYGIENEFLIGAAFIPWGIGSILGSPIAGVVSDRLIVKWRNKRKGIWVPEDRLRGATLAAYTCVPLSILGCGLTTHYVDGTLGLVLNLVFIFFNGLGVNLVLTPTAAYGVDVLKNRSAETMAATSVVRGTILALVVAGVIPSIRDYGVLWTDAFGAIFAWIGALLLWIVIKYGEELRGWSNVDYST